MKRLVTGPTLALALLVVIALGFVFLGNDDDVEPKRVTADFPRAVSIFEGTDVKILGVTVGSVVSVTPEGDKVRVVMEYDGEHDLPADAKAVIVTPTLVADRFVQLTPVYTGGEVMADGAEIALPETAVPVELDRIYSSLRDLTATLGPNGVNADGTLNHLLTAGANALEGQGATANRMLRNLAAAASTFGDSSGDLFETVTQLAEFTSTLAQNDELVRAFIADLADVSGQLSEERVELQRTLAAVADTVGSVRGFVKGNREALVTDVRKLSRIMRVIASEKKSLDDALNVAPVAIGNLSLAYNVDSGSIGSRIGVSGNLFDADGFLCSIVQQSALPKVSKTLACQLFAALLEPVQNELPTVPPAPRSGAPGPAARPGTGTGPGAGTGTPPSVQAFTSAEPPSLAELLAGGAS